MASVRVSLALVLSQAGLLACAARMPEEAPLPMRGGEGFFDAPWPDDARTDVEGRPLLDGFPGRDRVDLLDGYASQASTLRGFGNNSPIFFRFESAIELGLLPAVLDSTSESSPVLLLNVDPESPSFGERVPFAWDYRAEEDADEYEPANLLAVAPLFGFPLEPSTRYAVLVREPLAGVAPEMLATWDSAEPGYADRASLHQALKDLDVDLTRVAACAAFTTQDPVGETAAFAEYIQERLAIPALDPALVRVDDFQDFTAWEGWIWLPVWQEGERPYSSAGGALHHNELGEPAPFTWEYVHYALSIPKGVAEPAAGWPLVLMAHGTGGDYLSFVYPGSGTTEAAVLARRGVAALGIDQPLHGMRATPDTNVELHTFNFLNPEAARANFRQAALDMIYLSRVFGERSQVLRLPNGREVRIDPARMAFFGHSQGGLTGALAGPWLGSRLHAMALSGAGGGISITLVERKQGIDTQALLASFLGVETADVDVFHPVVGLLQWLVDVTDPVNYAPWWFSRQPAWSAVPIDTLMTEGREDIYTPPHTTETLAAAGRIPYLEPVTVVSEAQAARGAAVFSRPTTDNLVAWDGGPLTAGLAQYPYDGHFAVYDNLDASRLWGDFIASSLEALSPTIPD